MEIDSCPTRARYTLPFLHIQHARHVLQIATNLNNILIHAVRGSRSFSGRRARPRAAGLLAPRPAARPAAPGAPFALRAHEPWTSLWS